MVISEAHRKNISDRLKNYRAELKAKRTANKRTYVKVSPEAVQAEKTNII